MRLILLNVISYIVAASLLATGRPTLAGTDPKPALTSNTSALGITFQTPPWAQQRFGDCLLDFSKADAAVLEQQQTAPITFRGQPLNVTQRKGYYHGNVAIIRFGSEFYAAVRKIQFYLTLRTQVPDYPLDKDPSKKWISWWVSTISVCRVDGATLQPLSCSDFDPRSWKDEECMWSAGFESLGPEDPRLIVWPGKGLYIMFISKPWPLQPGSTQPSDTRCAGPWAQQPWIMPLVTYQQGSSNRSGTAGNLGQSNDLRSPETLDPWLKPDLIRLQYLPGSNGRHRRKKTTSHKLHKEKNWNAFVYNNQLYFSQSFDPHVVIKPNSNGTCIKVYETDSPVFKSLLPAKPKGNTQAVLLPAAVTAQQQDMYIGIVHTELNRSYTNYFYKMQAQPPFKITAVSAPIPLTPGTHPRITAWTHISFPMSLQFLEETQQLMIGYGSGDQAARVRLMGLVEALKLFNK